MVNERVQESTPFSGVSDGDRPVLRDVKLCGLVSKHGRRYPRDVLERAIEKYEAKGGYFDHDASPQRKGARKFEDKFCFYRGVYAREDGLYARELHYNPKHKNAEQFRWWVENAPEQLALSQSAVVQFVEGADGLKVATEVVEVESVDVVTSGGTTRSIFEDHLTHMYDEQGALADSVVRMLATILKDPNLETAEKQEKVMLLLQLTERKKAEEPDEMDQKDTQGAKPEEKDKMSQDKDKKPGEEKPVEKKDEKPVEKKEPAKESFDSISAKFDELLSSIEAKLAEKLEKVNESFAALEERAKAVKAPVSKAPDKGEQALTVDKLMEALSK